MASCTTTMVMVSTKVANDTIDTAIVVRMPIAASGPPVNQRGMSSKPVTRSTAIVPIDTSTPASTHSTGMNHRLDQTRDERAEMSMRPGASPPQHQVKPGRSERAREGPAGQAGRRRWLALRSHGPA